jgi:hypothetical protein
MTNSSFIFDPQALQTQVNALPPAWQHYVVMGIMALMVLGRILSSPTSPVTALKSVFLGSVHSILPKGTTTTTPLPLPTQTVVAATTTKAAVLPVTVTPSGPAQISK